MRAVVVLGASVCLLALALAIEAPATLVDARVDALTTGRVRVANATGTIWNGSGDVILPRGNARVPIAWRIEALPLAWGELRGTLTPNGASVASFELGATDATLRNFTLALPAEALLRAGDAPAIVAGAGGSVELHVETFSKHGDRLDGRISARWRDASVPGPRPEIRVALGELQAECSGSGREIPGTIANVGGDVDIQGTLSLASSGAVRVDATVRPREGIDVERRDAISSALSMAARPDASGAYRIVSQLGP